MKLELKNIKTTATGAFSASVYLDGKNVGMASNAGNGGPNSYLWKDAAAGKRINDHAIATFPQFTFEQLDFLISRELDRENMKKVLTKHCKKETLFRIPGEGTVGDWRTIKAPYSPATCTYIRGKYPTAVIVNEDIAKEASWAIENS